MKTKEKIVAYLKDKGDASANELVNYLGISRTAVFNQLKNLLSAGVVRKIGKPPKVFYLLKKEERLLDEIELDDKIKETIEENYLMITPTGERKDGLDGFFYWCRKNNLPIKKTAKEYVKTINKYSAFKRNGVINGKDKFISTFANFNLNGVFYLDFYNIERFGKTKLGQLLLYAKQSQNRRIIKELIDDIRPMVNRLVEKYKIDAIGFIPPSVKREVQFMKELEKNLRPEVKKISIIKIKTDVIVPQKTLSKLEDRIENAKKTIIVDDVGNYKNVLLIDDAVGSGATLNETAFQIKDKGIAKKVFGLAITGSFKGFDVISEV